MHMWLNVIESLTTSPVAEYNCSMVQGRLNACLYGHEIGKGSL